jgi:hypothetical protein
MYQTFHEDIMIAIISIAFVLLNCSIGNAATLEEFITGTQKDCTYKYESSNGRPLIEMEVKPKADGMGASIKEKMRLPSIGNMPDSTQSEYDMTIDNDFLIRKSGKTVTRLIPRDFENFKSTWTNEYHSRMTPDTTCHITSIKNEHIFGEDRQIINVLCVGKSEFASFGNRMEFASGIGMIKFSHSLISSDRESIEIYTLTNIDCK